MRQVTETATFKRPAAVPQLSTPRNLQGSRLREQKGITITHKEIGGRDYFFCDNKVDMKPMIDLVQTYVRRRLTETSR